MSRPNEKAYTCCICGKFCTDYGNNPWGAAWRTPEGFIETVEFKEDERCCNECNEKYVIPGRLYRLRNGGKKDNEQGTKN